MLTPSNEFIVNTVAKFIRHLARMLDIEDAHLIRLSKEIDELIVLVNQHGSDNLKRIVSSTRAIWDAVLVTNN